MTVTYPKSGLQDGVAFQQNGKPGTYPVQAWNDEIGTFQFASTLTEGTVIPFGAAVVKGKAEDGIRLPSAEDVFVPVAGGEGEEDVDANAVFAGVAVFNYYATTQANGFKKQDLDVNVAVKQKGYVTVLMTSLAGVEFGSLVTIDSAHPGNFKLAGEGDTVFGKVNKVFPAYGTAEIELKEFI